MHKLIAEVVDEMGMAEKSIGVSPVGCGVFAYNYLDIDFHEAAHGRAAAVATGIKRVLPDHLVFTYQGDGDAAGIGTNETLHALNRGEGITIIFINNAIYGMTGGQMAPTTLMGQVTSTSPYGRDAALHGYPLKLGEIAALLEGTAFVTRQSVDTMGAIAKNQKGDPQSLRHFNATQRLVPGRNRFNLLVRMEAFAGQLQQVDARQHVPLLSERGS